MNAQNPKKSKNVKCRSYDLLAQLQVQNKNPDQASAAAEKAIETEFELTVRP